MIQEIKRVLIRSDGIKYIIIPRKSLIKEGEFVSIKPVFEGVEKETNIKPVETLKPVSLVDYKAKYYDLCKNNMRKVNRRDEEIRKLKDIIKDFSEENLRMIEEIKVSKVQSGAKYAT